VCDDQKSDVARGLRELAFALHDAIVPSVSAVLVFCDDARKENTRELVKAAGESATIDSNPKKSVRVAMRSNVCLIPACCGYPPVTETEVLEQTEQFAAGESEGGSK
jgi:hypothetical protein